MLNPEPQTLFSRRAFLRLSLAASALAIRFSLPLDAFAETTSHTGAPVPARKPRAPRFLMIDPGHGGRDPGAIGISGTHEKDVTLDIGRRMANALSARPGMTVDLTRDEILSCRWMIA